MVMFGAMIFIMVVQIIFILDSVMINTNYIINN